MPEQMNGSQATIAQLVAEGVTHLLSIPGEHNISLCDAILDRPELTYLTGRHEQSLTLIANGYSRVSHQIAVPLIISGPGVTNALTALGDAYQDSVPMVVIAAQAARSQIGKGSFHGLKDQGGAIASVAKWHTQVESPAAIPEAIRTAFTQAYTGRPGPTVVEIPLDVQSQEAKVEIYPCQRPQPTPTDANSIQKAAQLLANAQFPLVIAGRGVGISGATAQLQQLIEGLNAPCFLTALGKGLLRENHPLNISWGNGRSDYITQQVAQADAVLVVGSSLDYADAGRLKFTFPKTLIHIDSCPEIIGRTYPVKIGLVGDAKQVLDFLWEALKQQLPTPHPFRPPQIQSEGHSVTFLQHKNHKLATFKVTTAWQYMQAINHAIADDTLVFGDPARCNGWGVAFLERNLPNTYHCSRNFCTLGFAVSAAMGAKLAQPQRQVLAMIGDGGLLFANGDLATAIQYDIDIVILLFNDNCYGSIRRAQRDRFGRTIGIDLKNPDFCALAQSFGMKAWRVHQPDQLPSILARGWQLNTPCLIEIAMTANDPGFEI
jgi:thiamine pyrophosphate-dependent acetolactate synthase large subunit-like protein